jgi:hypothetical protein
MKGKDVPLSPESLGSKDRMLIEKLPAGTQVVAPMEGTVSFEYNEVDKQPDGLLNKGKVVVESKDGNGNVIRIAMEASGIQLLGGSVASSVTAERGVVKSSQGIPVKMGEPLFTLKSQPTEVLITPSRVIPTSGNSSSV